MGGKKEWKERKNNLANVPLKGPAAEVCLDSDFFIGLCGKGFLVRICEELLEMVVVAVSEGPAHSTQSNTLADLNWDNTRTFLCDEDINGVLLGTLRQEGMILFFHFDRY